MPYTDKADPNRIKRFNDIDEPIITKSSTDKLDPSLETPYTDSAEPQRANERKDIEDPMWTKSSTENEDPKRVKP
jgi:hypothetical protein